MLHANWFQLLMTFLHWISNELTWLSQIFNIIRVIQCFLLISCQKKSTYYYVLELCDAGYKNIRCCRNAAMIYDVCICCIIMGKIGAFRGEHYENIAIKHIWDIMVDIFQLTNLLLLGPTFQQPTHLYVIPHDSWIRDWCYKFTHTMLGCVYPSIYVN